MKRLLLLVVLALLAGATPALADASSLPADGPPALYRAEPSLPRAEGWPGPDAWPRTSGSGRLDQGALLWTDWLYDDHGAVSAPGADLAETGGTPSFGNYGYDSPDAHANGADIFRAGILLHDGATYWRVDWTTLAKASVPIAEWTFDRDDDAATGVSAWTAGAGVSSPGIDTALVVTSSGAVLTDLVTGHVLASRPVTTDLAARSMVVRVPTSVLPVTGTWRVRLASGASDGAGGFARPAGALPGRTSVYNVTFRTRSQEPVADSYWDDMTQTEQLALGSVASFSTTVSWAALSAGRTTAEGRPTGWSDRWYVSDVELGPGIVSDAATVADNLPNFLGRVQPYAIYIPTHHAATGIPLTFLLHSSNQNHNQYAATTPSFTRAACEQRQSVCVSPLGRGPDGNYVDTAQLDFWQVWHLVAALYPLDPDRTITSGYSLGGLGSNEIAMAHPDLFAEDVTMAGAVGAVPEVENLRSVPVYQAGGVEDELVPFPVEKAEADALKALGYRYRWLVYPAEDHVGFELKDGFGDAAAFMGSARRETHPAHVTLRWSPTEVDYDASDPTEGADGNVVLAQTQRPDLGVGTTGAYWMRSLVGRRGAAFARVDATSLALADPAVTLLPTTDTQVPGSPSPAVVFQQAWKLGTSAPRRAQVRLALTSVTSATLLLTDAGLPRSGCGTVTVTSDGPGSLALQGFSAAQTVVPYTKGTRSLSLRTSASAAPQLVGRCSALPPARAGSLPATGPDAAPPLLGALVLLGCAGGVRARARRRPDRRAAGRRRAR